MAQCKVCATYACDNWGFQYILFYKHHPHCPNNDSKVDLKEFKEILTSVLDAHNERKKKQAWMKEAKENLRK